MARNRLLVWTLFLLLFLPVEFVAVGLLAITSAQIHDQRVRGRERIFKPLPTPTVARDAAGSAPRPDGR